MIKNIQPIRIRNVAIICLSYLILTIFYHHIEKHLSGVLYFVLTFLIPVTFIGIIVYLIKGLIQIVRNRSNITFKLITPAIFALTTLCYIFFSPWRLDSEKLESRVEMRACYEGTQNQAYINFRQDKSFEVKWTGVFGYNEWWTGQWKKSGDSMFLKYDNRKLPALGDSILLTNGYLNPFGKSFDTNKFHRPMFYLGYCRHEN